MIPTNVYCLYLILKEATSTYLTQIYFMQIPLLAQSTDTNVTVLPIQEECLVDVFWGAF